jgi:hypothetical protein
VDDLNDGRRGLGRGRKGPEECAHAAPILVEGVRYGYGARCLLCGTVGPARDSAEGAREALQAARR